MMSQEITERVKQIVIDYNDPRPFNDAAEMAAKDTEINHYRAALAVIAARLCKYTDGPHHVVRCKGDRPCLSCIAHRALGLSDAV